LCRLWLSEGVPFMFLQQPMMYEAVRSWLGFRLKIHPKEITLIGSARLGFSLTPSNLGRSFGTHSDLDLVAVSEDLFFHLDGEVEKFYSDLESGTISVTDRTKRFWPESAADLIRSKNQRGFIDSWKIPSLDRYPKAKSIANTCWQLTEKLKVSNESYDVKGASIRVYRDLHSFIRQNWINLKNLSSQKENSRTHV
jgi:hypothetical protein